MHSIKHYTLQEWWQMQFLQTKRSVPRAGKSSTSSNILGKSFLGKSFLSKSFVGKRFPISLKLFLTKVSCFFIYAFMMLFKSYTKSLLKAFYILGIKLY